MYTLYIISCVLCYYRKIIVHSLLCYTIGLKRDNSRETYAGMDDLERCMWDRVTERGVCETRCLREVHVGPNGRY
jgi:hypothetical protein